jgi:hypothetical protein
VELLTAILPAGLFAGIVAVLVTVAIERWGGRVGGVLGTMPTTIVPAALGIAAQTVSDAAFAQAINMAPAGMFLNALFLYLWRLVPPRLPQRWSLRARLAAMTALSLLSWALAATVVVLGVRRLAGVGLSLPLFGALTTVALAALGLAASARPIPAPRGRNRVGPLTLVARGALAAAAVGLAVWLASTGLGLLSGVASVFPAIFLTTMFSLWLAQGEAVPAGAVGPMMLGSTSVAAFCVAATYSFPLLGPAPGAALAWVLAVAAVTLPAGLWLGRRR